MRAFSSYLQGTSTLSVCFLTARLAAYELSTDDHTLVSAYTSCRLTTDRVTWTLFARF